MAKLLINDDIDLESMFCHTHVVSKDKKLISVFLGAPQTMIRGLVGVYVSDKDYDLIDHNKAYIFIHDPDATENDIENIDWGTFKPIENKKTNREHMHIWNR